MALLEIRGLSVTIPSAAGAVQAVRHVDLQIERGEIHGLIGEVRLWQDHDGHGASGPCAAGRTGGGRGFPL